MYFFDEHGDEAGATRPRSQISAATGRITIRKKAV